MKINIYKTEPRTNTITNVYSNNYRAEAEAIKTAVMKIKEHRNHAKSIYQTQSIMLHWTA